MNWKKYTDKELHIVCNNTKLYVYITEREEWQIYIIKTES